MDSSKYIAKVCRNGHLLESHLNNESEDDRAFCPECGQPTMTHCENCGDPIPGSSRPRPGWLVSSIKKPPSYCTGCGKPYPWTESAIEAAQEMIDFYAADLDQEQLEKIKSGIPDLAGDTAKTDIAIQRLKSIANRIGSDAYKIIVKVTADFASEYAKNQLM